MELARDSNQGPRPIAAIQRALRDAGADWEALRPSDLWPIDQLHIGDSSATLTLADRAGLSGAMRVLDVGGGLGGPARILAHEIGCEVILIEKVSEYARTAEELNRRTGLSDQISVECKCIFDCDFPRAIFDAVWCQHVSMNIQNKEAFFRELARVLRPPGRLAIHAVASGPNAAIRFPLPWARRPSESALISADGLRSLLEEVGFKEIEWLDMTEESIEWLRERRASASRPEKVRATPLQILFGAEGAVMTENLIHGLEEWQLEVIQGVLELR